MTEVIMPKMGDGMEEGTLLEWIKGEGSQVKTGEVIGTIQTDKATLELEAPGNGTLSGFLIQGGETVPVGQPIAAILKEGESLPGGWGGKSAQPGTGESLKDVAAPSEPMNDAPANAPIEMQQDATTPRIPESASSEFGISADQPTGATGRGTEETALQAKEASANGSASSAPTAPVSEGRVKASPLARRVAQERGVDLASVQGSGPGGRIVLKDVPEAPTAAPSAPATAPQPVAPAAEDRSVTLGRLRQITAKRTTESKQQVPHFYVTVEVDLERILTLREMFEVEESGKVSINDFAIRACALALKDMPEVNATFQGQTVLQHGAIHVGIAAAIDEGLTVPVIRDADKLSLRQISVRSKELVKKAKENKLGMDEVTGSTFSISNMGMLDVDNFVAIINQPNAAIVAISTARRKVVVGENDEVEIRSRMNLTGSFDHRVVDGAGGARFMNLVKAYLENPTRLLA